MTISPNPWLMPAEPTPEDTQLILGQTSLTKSPPTSNTSSPSHVSSNTDRPNLRHIDPHRVAVVAQDPPDSHDTKPTALTPAPSGTRSESPPVVPSKSTPSLLPMRDSNNQQLPVTGHSPAKRSEAPTSRIPAILDERPTDPGSTPVLLAYTQPTHSFGVPPQTDRPNGGVPKEGSQPPSAVVEPTSAPRFPMGMASAPRLPGMVDCLTQIPWSGEAAIDWEVVAQMRTAASKRLSARIGSQSVDAEHQQVLGRNIITDLLEEHTSQAISRGTPGWDSTYQAQMGQAIFDALFRLGRLQGLVDDESIENVIICGADNVWLEYCDGSLRPGPPVADSDQELIDFLSFIASRSEVNERTFSPAEPRLHLRLDSGARLAASAWVTPRPSVVIRRHRVQEITLDELVQRGTLAQSAARFLTEAVRRRASIVVCGAQGAGKTTLMRALCAEIPPHEIIGTFETEYELHLHHMPHRHHVVYAWEARPGSGEMNAAGRRAGEYLLDDALYDSFRFNLSRQIVGEVRGREILAMLKAMQSGSGSLSTTHAHSAEAAIRKLITCAMEAGPQVTSEYATRAVADDIDFVVHMEVSTTRSGSGFQRHRWVKEILAVEASDSVRGYSTTRLFSTTSGERSAGMERLPQGYLQSLDDEIRNLTCP